MSDPAEKRYYMRGNEAIAYGALHAGMNSYFAYPITPSSEVPETLAKEYGNKKYPEFKVFIQAASELEAINMTIGAAATGAKVMTFTSSPGFSLKQEGLSYATGMQIPFIIGNVNRGGPGLGNIAPEQSDYNQCTKGGGHGGYKLITLAPNSVQENAAAPALAFDLAFKYRQPVIILTDAFTGQIKEDISFPEISKQKYDTSWALSGAKDREPKILNSLHLEVEVLEEVVHGFKGKWEKMQKEEVRFEQYMCEDAELVVMAYGIMSRISKAAVNKAREAGLKVGLFRPMTLWPFPKEKIREMAEKVSQFIVVELNVGLMVEDVRYAVLESVPVESMWKVGGGMISEKEIHEKIKEMI